MDVQEQRHSLSTKAATRKRRRHDRSPSGSIEILSSGTENTNNNNNRREREERNLIAARDIILHKKQRGRDDRSRSNSEQENENTSFQLRFTPSPPRKARRLREIQREAEDRMDDENLMNLAYQSDIPDALRARSRSHKRKRKIDGYDNQQEDGRRRVGSVASMEEPTTMTPNALAGMMDPLAMCDTSPVAEPRDPVDNSVFVEDVNDPVTDPDFCLWNYAQSIEQTKQNPMYGDIVRMHQENVGKVSPGVLVRMLQKEYNKNLRDCLMVRLPDDSYVRKRGPVWPAKSILAYTNGGIAIPLLIYEDIARTYTKVLKVITNNMLFERTPGALDPVVNMKVLDAFHKAVEKTDNIITKLEKLRNTNLYGRV